ncbi:PREDICTED: uncharacterized protein LOC108447126 [Corvus brachyrhynchos]|uniref:uncharacterized protein LOC108447126 n=1 Tax=Corvus brachyrhynchos TaxID=85066 RepID=UPI000816749D|nr:PREDICTED: uncharacterized protein LOC108447126 [Corvus brachyrhynchos]XP_017591640.1 PREDICTED: uncharacterized protein LOC108447126 [Corvus brachyrhynchos]
MRPAGPARSQLPLCHSDAGVSPLLVPPLRGVAASAHVGQPRWRGTKSCRGTLGPCDGGRQSRGLAHTPCPACATVPAMLGEGKGLRTLSPLLRGVGRSHTQLGWPWMPHGHARALPSCHSRGGQGEDPTVAGMNPSKPTRERRTPSWEHRQRPVRCPYGFRGAAASRIPLKANPPWIAPHTSGTPRNRGAGVPTRPPSPGQGSSGGSGAGVSGAGRCCPRTARLRDDPGANFLAGGSQERQGLTCGQPRLPPQPAAREGATSALDVAGWRTCCPRGASTQRRGEAFLSLQGFGISWARRLHPHLPGMALGTSQRRLHLGGTHQKEGDGAQPFPEQRPLPVRCQSSRASL